MHANYREKVINDDKISSFDVKNRDFCNYSAMCAVAHFCAREKLITKVVPMNFN